MFDYNQLVTLQDLHTIFRKQPSGYYTAYDSETKNEVGVIKSNGATFECDNDDLFIQFKLWQVSPMAKLGNPVDLSGLTVLDMIDLYEELLIGGLILARGSEAKARTNYRSVIDWLRSTDFYRAPASTKYHEPYVGGLLVHSLKVYNQAVQLMKLPSLSNVDVKDVVLASLMHDWCKIDFYESYTKNVKNEKTGQWEKQTAYMRNPKGVPLGHGVASMYLAGRCLNLNPELACAIRWHQGRWDCCEDELDTLQLANQRLPLVHLIQFADQLAVTDYAV